MSAPIDRPYFGLNWKQLKVAALEGRDLTESGAPDRVGVLEELSERTSRGACKLADELTGGSGNLSGDMKARPRAVEALTR